MIEPLQKKTPTIGISIINYNAVTQLIRTLERIPRAVYNSVAEIFLVDDCSTDNSYYAAWGYKHLKAVDKLTIHMNEKNQGYGGNQKVGYQYAIDRGFDIVALVHGDGQYAPEVLPELLEPLLKGEADMVFGSRMSTPGAALRGHMPLYKYCGNRILSFAQNRLTGLRLSEYHSGYRLYSVAALRQIPFHSFTNNWHFDTQIILAFAERRLRIVERPIPTYYGDEISRVNGIPYAVHCLLTSYRYFRNQRRGMLSYPGPLDTPRIVQS